MCDACRPGTYLDRTSNICRVCDVNCARCSGAGKCSLCEVGFFLNEGACKTACDTGRLPSVKSYWVSNNQLFSTISKNDIL